ncbi:MAG: AI-2E family transporter, partial [Myxococcaceae bacterium]
FLFNLMLVLMIAGFILVDTARIRRFAFSLVPLENQAAFDKILSKVDIGLSGVVRGQLIICVVNACLTLVGLLILKIKFALVLATLAGLFSLIPIFGSIISTVPIALIGLMTSPLNSLLAILWIAGIHALEANFLNPKILGSSAQIHPVLVVLSLVAGEHFYGLFGALLSVPIASILLTLFQSLLAKAHARQ